MKFQPSERHVECSPDPHDEVFEREDQAYEEKTATTVNLSQPHESTVSGEDINAERTLVDRLLWETKQVTVDAGPYRSTVLSHKQPTVVGKLIGFIHNNRKSLAALGMVASVSLAAKNVNELVKIMDPITSIGSNRIKDMQDPSTQMLVPYTVIGGVKVEVSASECLNGVVNDCQMNVGSGTRKINPAPPSKQEIINSQILNYKRY